MYAQKFYNISVDLIYGMPNSNLKEWEENLNRAFEFNPPHFLLMHLPLKKKQPLDYQVKKGDITLLMRGSVKNNMIFCQKMRSLKVYKL